MSTPDWREAHDAGRDSGYAAGRAEAGAELTSLRARVAEAVRMIEGYKRAGLLTNPATAEQATDFISRATGNKDEVRK